jgi:hypothetical protein
MRGPAITIMSAGTRMQPRFHFIAFRLAAVVLVALGLAACEGCRSTTPNGAANGAHAPSGGDLGSPTVRLYLLTDLAGALEPCGCTKDQLGGLDHFAAWVRSSSRQAPAAVVASAGPLFFMDDKASAERQGQDRIKAETMARVLHDLGFAAFAPGANDWIDGSEGFGKLAAASGAAVLGGVRDGEAVVREVGGLRIGFVGFGQGPNAGNTAASNASNASVEDAVRRGVQEAKKQGANVLIALAAVGRGEAKRIADAVPELTAVVVGSGRANGDGNTSAPQGEQVGTVLIAQAANHLQTVAVLDLYVREPVAPGHLIAFADGTGLDLARKREDLARRIDELHVKLAAWARDPSIAPGDVDARRAELAVLEGQRDALDRKAPPAAGNFFRYTVKEIRESLGKDPATEETLRAYYKSVNDHNRAAFADRVPVPAAAGQASFVGIEVCTNCHAGARTVWNGTAHAHAYATLSTQFKEFNLECVSCHVTGYDLPGGSTVTHVDKLQNVQCEVCHGPGSKHVLDPSAPGTLVERPSPDRCLACHHPPHVESFDPVAKLKEILGPGHGMPILPGAKSSP